jgi:molecular chaperone GrpE
VSDPFRRRYAPFNIPIRDRYSNRAEDAQRPRQERGDVSARLSQLETQLAELQAHNAELEERRNELEARNAELEARNAELQARNAELEAQLARQKDLAKAHEIRALQAADDIEKAKLRIEREATRSARQNRRAFLSHFLEVLDDLDRALEAAPATGDSMREGVELVRKRFLSTLAEHGVSYAPALGQPFDPNAHEAVATVPVDDPEADNTIVGELRKGYMIGDEVLRAARVAVGKYSA